MPEEKKKTTVKKKVPKKRAAKKAKKKQPEKPKGTCFVMMPFREPFEEYYYVIYEPAIKAVGLEPWRVDDLFRPSVIVADVWQMIQDADILFAELTTRNANVFYELGLAHALGKPVVLVSETLDDVPFDLQSLRAITYDKNDPNWGARLRADIKAALAEILENPVEGVPMVFREIVPGSRIEQNELDARVETLEKQMRTVIDRQTPSVPPGFRKRGELSILINYLIENTSDNTFIVKSLVNEIRCKRASFSTIRQLLFTKLPKTRAKEIIERISTEA